jgi:hypothetical protein
LKALRILAGPRARKHLQDRGLAPADVRAIPAAAGGPKGLTLLPLDGYLFGHWLPQSTQTVHLLGASIGAWRMAVACLPEPEAGLRLLADDYIMQSYPQEGGRMPTARVVSQVFRAGIESRLGSRAAEVLSHPRFRLHVFTSRGRGPLHRPGPLGLPLGWAAAFAANALHRRALGHCIERVVFSDPRDPLPFGLNDFRTQRAVLSAGNLAPVVLASCSIPFVLEAVADLPGGPAGSYWDGGITDYHLHLPYASMAEGLVLYPHFLNQVVPGWLDKAWKARHRATPALDNLVLLAPRAEWLRSLPGGKLPDRSDFKTYAHDHPRRQRDWRRALSESQRLADEFSDAVAGGRPIDAEPLP